METSSLNKVNSPNIVVGSGIQQINSRFGSIQIDVDKAVFLPNGLFGMPEKTHFCLANFPNVAYKKFKIFQCINDLELSFITLPLNELNMQLIDDKDKEICANLLERPVDELVFLLIVTVYYEIDEEGKKHSKITVNVKAPIVIDAVNNVALQYAFTNDKYDIRHVLS